MTLDEWLRHCERSHSAEIELTLDRVASVKERLEIRFRAPVIMVAGTNGKGSTCALLESLAQASGWRVGLYSKPHLVRFEERCRIGCRPVDAHALVPHFRAVESARGDTPLTYFEFTTLAILRLLSTVDVDVDLVILEVGLGGRCDAVNVIDADVAVITAIDLDHRDHLGPTRERIALEKAGIMRPGRSAVVTDPDPPVTLLEHGERIGARLCLAGRDYRLQQGPARWTWSGAERVLASLPMPALLGLGQLQNAAGALAALHILAIEQKLPRLRQADVARGLLAVRLTGRFQIVNRQPVVVIDVAHNVHSVRNMLASKLDHVGVGRTVAVFGCMQDKDIEGIFREMLPVVDHWYMTSLPTARAESAQGLSDRLSLLRQGVGDDGRSSVGDGVSTWPLPSAALAAALHSAAPSDTVLVFGSFYTVAGVIGAFDVDVGDGRGRLGATAQGEAVECGDNLQGSRG